MINPLSSSAMQNNALNAIISQLNALATNQARQMRMLGQAQVGIGEPPNNLPFLQSNLVIQFWGISGQNWLVVVFQNIPNVVPSQIPHTQSFNICNTIMWDSVVGMGANGQPLSPLFTQFSLGIMAQALINPTVQRQGLIRINITSTRNILAFFVPMSGNLWTNTTGTPINIPPCIVMLQNTIP